MSYNQTHVKREGKEHMMSRLQQHQQPQSGLALCPRVILDSVAHWWVPARTPTVHRCSKGKAVGGPTQPPQDNHRQTTTRQRQDLSLTCSQKQEQSYTWKPQKWSGLDVVCLFVNRLPDHVHPSGGGESCETLSTNLIGLGSLRCFHNRLCGVQASHPSSYLLHWSHQRIKVELGIVLHSARTV